MSDQDKNDEMYWENGSIGKDSETVHVVGKDEAANIDNAMELQMISIRLNKDLLADLKMFSKAYEMGYQPLIRDVLRRFVEGEKRVMYNSYLNQKREELDEKQA